MKKVVAKSMAIILIAGILVGDAVPVLATKSPTKSVQPKALIEVVAKEQNGVISTVNTKKDGTAVLTKVAQSDKKTIKVPSEIVVGGITYTVTKISAKAFIDCEQMKTVELPETITEIGAKAFSGAKELKKIKLVNKKAPKVSKTAFKGLDTKKMTILYNSKMSKAQIKLLKTRMEKAGFKGKVKKSK